MDTVEIERRIKHLEDSLEQADRRNAALELVVGWLLARHPKADTLFFLASQAHVLDGHPNYVEDVALLDELREQVSHWYVMHDNAQQQPKGEHEV